MSETPPNEVPREAGEFWFMRLKKGGNVRTGKTVKLDGILMFECSSEMYITEHGFSKYDWHKIQLPEGWR